MIRIIAEPVCSVSPRRSSRTCAWIVTSSAVVGSSAIISFGSSASAMAIITRWRMPPGELVREVVEPVSGCGMPTICEELDRAGASLVPADLRGGP